MKGRFADLYPQTAEEVARASVHAAGNVEPDDLDNDDRLAAAMMRREPSVTLERAREIIVRERKKYKDYVEYIDGL